MNSALSQLHIDLAAVLRQQGDLAAAANCYRQAIALAPDAETYHRLGLTLFEQEQWTEAIACYRQAIELGRGVGGRGSGVGWARVYSDLGCALVRQGEVNTAIAQFRQGLQLAPNWAGLYVNLGQAVALQGSGGDRAAVACLERAIELEPDGVDGVVAYWHLAQLRQQQGCWPEAIALWQRVIERSPSDVAAWGELAVAQMAQGDWQGAIESLRRAIEVEPAFVEPFVEAFGQQVGRSSNRDEWMEMQRSTARFLASLRSIEADALQRLAETYLDRAKLLWQYGGDRQIQQADRDVALAQRIAQAANFQIETPERSIEQATSPQAVYATAAAWFAAVRSQGRYVELQPGRSIAATNAAEACAGLNCAPCLQQLQRQFAPVHLGQGTYACDREKACGHGGAIEPTPLFVAQIPQGRAWAVPQINDWRICNAVAVLTPADELLSDLARDYPGQLPNCRQSAPHRIWTAKRSPIEPIEGTVAAIASLSGHVYFHWMIDILPRLDLIRQSGCDWQAIDRVWLNSGALRFQRETLEALGIPAAKILSSDRHPHIQAETLIAPSFVSPLGWASVKTLNFLREQFLPIASPKKWPPRIYVSRRSSRYRRVLNEDAVLDLLRPAGFVPVLLESLSLADQVSLFAQAEAIVAPHGSGLTNLAFCRPETVVIELFSPEYVRPYYWAIAAHLQLRHSYALGRSFACRPLQSLMHPNPLTADILVNLAALKQLLKTAQLLGTVAC